MTPDAVTTISTITRRDGSTVVVKRRRTRSWKTEAQNWERNYRQAVRWEVTGLVLAFLLGLGLGVVLG